MAIGKITIVPKRVRGAVAGGGGGGGGGVYPLVCPPMRDARWRIWSEVRRFARPPICESWFSWYLSANVAKLSERKEATSLYITPSRLIGL